MAPPTDFLENSMGSRLLSLPAELRNIIYELTFTTDYDDDEKIRHSRTSRHVRGLLDVLAAILLDATRA